mmetsp:Transcript_7277/g.11499  ORF Transcript_7277/g.11499 Transcript_7277/m.11499 type:complete len:513 (-) Transcript_7277:804-2342(-)|eukprot:CAMPEP_0178754222 /NCGR_PEP_ID=MMETSP0744-20121128/12044_1 /TAXON_ID=913974 /ORGANISM="Nitzschia punctata, Strain CCMP561" /LENGTH=512 /DNA_ID=CAMNT_0020408119 /DNA_START=161 /DNA_END=1699 /DNA_ORIENTATION=+
MSHEYPVKWTDQSGTEVGISDTDDQERQQNPYDSSSDDYQYNDKSGPSSRKKLCLVGICLLVIVGAVVGVSVGILSTREEKNASKYGGSGAVGDPGNYGGDTPIAQYAGAPTMSPGPTPSNAYEIADIIDSVARFGGSEFNDPNSYQYRARQWVLTQDFPVPDGSSLSTEQQAIQLYALACIYYSTYAVRSAWTDFQYGKDVAIPGWFSSRGWLGSAVDVCNWYGLTCNEEGRIQKIELDTNGLTGFLPPETAYLHESLNTIDLYNNLLHNKGDEGNSFLGELTNLEYLFIGSTSFEYDGVPTVLGRLTKLQELDFSYTLYFGALNGDTFASLSNLKYLVMDGNAYNSSLPEQLIQLPELEYLYSGFSFLEGDLEFIPRMPKIFELWIDDNPGIAGTLPTTIGQSSTLVSLSVTNCNLSGPIPSELGQLTDMVQMWLYDNSLTGTIPSELGHLIKMKTLNLQMNQLVGEMPANICGRRRPFGRLEELEADCDGEIICDETCCTCCGEQCIDL